LLRINKDPATENNLVSSCAATDTSEEGASIVTYTTGEIMLGSLSIVYLLKFYSLGN
jgi:hypothetical protein